MAYPMVDADAREHACEQCKKQYSCKFCPRAFFAASILTADAKTPELLEKQEKVCPAEKPYACKSCSKAYFRRSHLIKHYLRVHTSRKQRRVKPQSCEKCLMPTSSCLCFKQHIDTYSAENLSSSEYCSDNFFADSSLTTDANIEAEENTSEFGSQPELLERQEGVHLAEKIYACKACSNAYFRPAQLIRHYLKVHCENQSHVKQQLCEQCITPSSCLCLKQRIETCSAKHQFSSEYCSEAFQTASSLTAGAKVETVKNISYYEIRPQAYLLPELLEEQESFRLAEKLFACKLCPEAYVTLRWLQKHYLKVHCEKQNHVKTQSDVKPQLCGQCLKLPSSCLCVKAIKTTPPAEKQYPCKLCPKAYFSLTLLEKHCLKFHSSENHIDEHTEEKLYTCKYCSSTFCGDSAMRKHERTHFGGKAYVCEFCSRLFSVGSNFRNHVKTHTGERPYSCHCCGGTFSSAVDLKSHMKDHSTDRPFPCPFCSKMFASNNVKQEHMRAHTGERPYSCDCCFKSFSSLNILNLHIIGFHLSRKKNS